jgi:flagellar biosynthesis GTPase FlhF
MVNLMELMKAKPQEPIKPIKQDISPNATRLINIVEQVKKDIEYVSGVETKPTIPVNGHKPVVDIRSLPISERIRLRAEAQLAKQHKTETAKADTMLENKLSGMDLAFPSVPNKPQTVVRTIVKPPEDSNETFSLSIKLNKEQQLAAEYAAANKCFVLTGAAGTGKTTAAREIAKGLLSSGNIGTHNFYVGEGQHITGPSIAFCAFTNRASSNMRRALHKDVELETKLRQCSDSP